MPSWRTEALRGYAERQAALRRELRVSFANMWRNLPGFVQLMRDGITDSITVSNQQIPTSSIGSAMLNV